MHTDHGAVPIERIKVGDKIWARNERTGATELRRVTHIAPQHFDRLMELRIAGEKSALHPTPTHPFRARRKAGEPAHWIDASDLAAGMQLLAQDGRWLTIESVAALDKPAVVYNFTVEEDHDYFVGDEGSLVHNAGLCAWVDNGALKIRNRFPVGSEEDTAFRDFINQWNQQVQDAGSLTRQAVTDEMRYAADQAARAARNASPELYPPGTAASHVPDVGWGGNPNGPITPLPQPVNGYIGGATQAVPPGTTYTSVGIDE